VDRAGVRWRAAKGHNALAEHFDGTTEAA
jgi:hypothetical protein